MNDQRRGDEAPTVDGPFSLAFELLGAIPRLAERTRAQADFTRAMLSHLPCVGAWFRQGYDVPVPDHEARQPTDVLTVVALTDDEVAASGVPAKEATTSTATSEPVPDTAVPDTAVLDTAVPDAAALGIPDYDSLAASQVVPRLTLLTPAELAAVGAYEGANRRRQTILNRVAQLLAG